MSIPVMEAHSGPFRSISLHSGPFLLLYAPFGTFGKPRMTTRAFVIVRVTDVTETSEF